MTEPGDKLAKQYRDLAREEPPAALDAAILAASRRAVAPPSLSRRWAMPASIAAVLVLAFGVTLEMQREEPGVATTTPQYKSTAPAPPAAKEPVLTLDRAISSAPPPAQSGPAPNKAPASRKRAASEAQPAPAGRLESDAPPEVKRADAPAEAFERPAEPKAFADSAAPANAPLAPQSSASPSDESRTSGTRDKREAANALQSPARAPAAISEPDRELERIARMRAEGRHDEADKALAEFRRKNPEYRIPETMWERVKPR